jgi:hypothetical protein
MKVGSRLDFARNTRFGLGILFPFFAALQLSQPAFASGVAAERRAPAADARPPQSNGNAAGGTRATTRATDERFGGSEAATAARNEPASSTNTSPLQLLVVKPRTRKYREACSNQRRAVDRFAPKHVPTRDTCPDFPVR